MLYEAGFLAQYMGTFDVIGTDPYPINAPYNASSTDGQAAKVGQEVDTSQVSHALSHPCYACYRSLDFSCCLFVPLAPLEGGN